MSLEVNSNFKIILGDVTKSLKSLDDEIIQTVVTSPPYWGLRDYGAENQIGQELNPDLYVETMVELFREIKRVLKNDGTVWLNVGDTYVGTGHKKDSKDPKYKDGRNGQSIALNNKVDGLKSKDMIGIPWKLAFALQADGWYLRSDIIWQKPNVLPSPVKDRPVSSYEHVFLLSKSKQYLYNYDAVKVPTTDGTGTRSLRDVWSVNTQPFPDAHFAVYPKELITPCILAGSNENDIVLDPFSGTGTTGIVALENNRNYIGFEINKAFAEMSIKRAKKELDKEFRVIKNF